MLTNDDAKKYGACSTFLALALPVFIALHVDEGADLTAPQINVMIVSQKLTHNPDGRPYFRVPEGNWIVKGKVPNNTRIDVGCPTGAAAEKTDGTITFSGPMGNDVSIHRCDGAFERIKINTTEIGERFYLTSTHPDFFSAGQIGSHATLFFSGDAIIGTLGNNAFMQAQSAYIKSAHGMESYIKYLSIDHLTKNDTLTVNSGKSTAISFMGVGTKVIVSSGHLEIFEMAKNASVMVPEDASWYYDVSIAVKRVIEGGNIFATWQAMSDDNRLIPLTFYSQPNQAIVTGNFDVAAPHGVGRSVVNINGLLQIPDDTIVDPAFLKAKGGIINYK